MPEIYKSHEASRLEPDRLETTTNQFKMPKETNALWNQHRLTDTQNAISCTSSTDVNQTKTATVE